MANQFMYSSNRTYNVDKIWFCSDDHAPRVVALSDQKKVRCRTSGNKSQVTVIACMSASGQCMSLFVIFDVIRLNLKRWNGEVVGTSYCILA